ncbi:nitrite reductase large subunit NirB [Cohnella thailandensis]|uniref:NAD(P)/FAD-dependent oxidoreductase n=1 Tax=Cohnella thailandensis TaxID=557557 RepID=A0A841SNU4_9BACL|nr:nitrite reductase large subunit NirB [Cohnella thailandensis]MBB6633614.1 NAD(P)/FAD-dependent oxidoreductase [Cohnella thailandensis]MBP1976398.1 nitrite reductase (NADH) large subunit [Cohnella thailandensis]
MSKMRLVVVGNGMAGVRCVEEICELAPDKYEITIIGSEPHPNYNRILLSKVLQGDASMEEIILNPWQWYEERGIRLFAGQKAVRVDTDVKFVETQTGLRLEYDRLILATGSSAFIPQLPGIGKPGVIAFRSMEDCRKMVEAAGQYRRAVVIGGGLLGLEAARGLLNLGMEVTVIHNASYLMNRQLDRTSAEMLRKELESQGMQFLFGKLTERILGRKRAEGVQFSDGSKQRADLIVMAVGIRPNVELGKTSGIHVNRAFVVDDYLRTNVPDVYAVGECAEHEGIVYGLVAPLYEQGKVLARRLCDAETEPYRGSIPYAQLKVSGVDVYSVGRIDDGEGEIAYQSLDGIQGTYKKILTDRGKISGAILYGDISEGSKLLQHLKRGTDISAIARTFSSGGGDRGEDAAASMPESEIVCNCNSVSKAAIIRAVQEGGLKTVEEVKERTKASGSCGGCKPMVSAVLRLAQSGAVQATVEKEPAVCGCTELGHSALKAILEERRFARLDQAMAELGWRTPSGCTSCRPAILYYSRDGESLNKKRAEWDSVKLSYGTGGDFEQAAGIGLTLEHSLSGLRLPNPLTIAVDVGSKGRGGLLVKELGISLAPAGWEIYAGGNETIPVRQAQLIAVEPSLGTAVDLIVACCVWYGNSAYYGEPMWRWLDRIGLIGVRERLLDPEARVDLLLEKPAGASDPKIAIGAGWGEGHAGD